MSCDELLRTRLRESGLRMTPQREIVLAVLHEIAGLETAEAIFGLARQKSSVIDKSTVYRTLELFHELDLVMMVQAPGSVRLYGHAIDAPGHAHLSCQACGAVQPLPAEIADRLANGLREGLGFVPDLANLVISGICTVCEGRDHAHS